MFLILWWRTKECCLLLYRISSEYAYPTEEAEASIPTKTVNTHRNDANNAAPAINDKWRVSGKAVAAVDDAATDAAGTA
jgi:hypothetical protein